MAVGWRSWGHKRGAWQAVAHRTDKTCCLFCVTLKSQKVFKFLNGWKKIMEVWCFGLWTHPRNILILLLRLIKPKILTISSLIVKVCWLLTWAFTSLKKERSSISFLSGSFSVLFHSIQYNRHSRAGLCVGTVGKWRWNRPVSHWALGLRGIAFFRGRGFVLEEKENISGNAVCNEQNELICESLASNHSPPRALPELASVIARMPGEGFVFVGKRKTSSFLQGTEINGGKSERGSPFYFKNERESVVWTGFRQESALIQLLAGQLGFVASWSIKAS